MSWEPNRSGWENLVRLGWGEKMVPTRRLSRARLASRSVVARARRISFLPTHQTPALAAAAQRAACRTRVCRRRGRQRNFSVM